MNSTGDLIRSLIFSILALLVHCGVWTLPTRWTTQSLRCWTPLFLWWIAGIYFKLLIFLLIHWSPLWYSVFKLDNKFPNQAMLYQLQLLSAVHSVLHMLQEQELCTSGHRVCSLEASSWLAKNVTFYQII